MWFASLRSPPDSSSPRSAGAELIRELFLGAAALAAIAAIWDWVRAGRVEGSWGLVALGVIAAPAATLAAVSIVLRARQQPERRRSRTGAARFDDKTPTPTPLILPPK